MVPLMACPLRAWEAIVATDYRDDASLYVSHTLFPTCKGVAHAAKGELDDARRRRPPRRRARNAQEGDRLHYNVDLVEMAAIADAVLAGGWRPRRRPRRRVRGARARGRPFDALPYDEPHGWLMSVRDARRPPRRAGRHARAIEVYLEDLELFPRNLGLADSSAMPRPPTRPRRDGEALDAALRRRRDPRELRVRAEPLGLVLRPA